MIHPIQIIFKYFYILYILYEKKVVNCRVLEIDIKSKNNKTNNTLIGIYVLKTNKHFYIGLSNNLDKRKREHFYKLNRNEHPNIKLQNVYNKGYNIEFEIIQECNIEDLNRLEIFWMDLYSILHPELKSLNLKSGIEVKINIEVL